MTGRDDAELAATIERLRREHEAAAVPVASVLSGRLTSHRGPRVTMITGLVLGRPGCSA